MAPFISNQGIRLPYGYGIFTQKFMNKKLVWGYGQEDCFSSLLLKVPEERITLVLLANNNLMSDPARLINGDITYSLFALNFLKNFVFDLEIKSGFSHYKNVENPEALKAKESSNDIGPFYRQELLAQALAASFMGYADTAELARSRQLTNTALKQFPNYEKYGDNSLMHLLMVLSVYGDIREFDKIIENVGERLITEYTYNPYANYYLGAHFAHLGNQDKAFEYFNRLDVSKNFQSFWYTTEAWDFLGDYYKKDDPSLAKSYFQKIIDFGLDISGKLDKAKQEAEKL